MKGSDSSEHLHDEGSDFDSVKSAYCKVDRVNVSPPDLSTRLYLIEREFRKAREATTLEEVTSRAQEALLSLQDLGVFRKANVEMVSGDLNKPGTCHIDVNAEELSKLTYKVGSFVSRSDISFEGMVRLRNLLGWCEHFSVEVARSVRKTTDISISCRKPRIYGLPVHVRGMLHQRYENFQQQSSYSETLRGGNVEAISSDGSHRLGYELSWMQLYDLQRVASPAVRRQLGDHIKSAAMYTFIHDARDSPVNPTRGSAFKAATEIGGLSPDVNVLRYVRQTLDLQVVSSLSPKVTMTVDANMGLMLPILDSWKANRATFIHDRFFVGGVGSLRGFRQRGVGPKDARRDVVDPEKVAGNGDDPSTSAAKYDDLGADVFATLRAAIHFELPIDLFRKAGICGQVFADTGSAAALTGTDASVQSNFAEFWEKWRLSVGGGIRIPLGPSGNFEVNFVQVLKSYQGDRVYPGLQLGFSSAPFMQVPPCMT